MKSKTSTVQGELGKQKNRYRQERKGFIPAPPALKTAKFVEKLNLLCIPNLYRKCACRSLLLLCNSGKMRKFLWGKKEEENELGTQGFFSENVGLGLLYIFLSGWVCAAFVPLSKRPENWRDVFRRSDYPKFHKVLFLHSDIQDLHRATKKKKVVYNRVFLFENQFFNTVFKLRNFRWKKKLACFLACFFFCSFQVFFEFSFKQNSASFLPSCISFL